MIVLLHVSAGTVARSDMVSQYDGAVVARLFVQRVDHLVAEGNRKADEEIAAAKQQESWATKVSMTCRSDASVLRDQFSRVSLMPLLVQDDGDETALSEEVAIRAEDLPLRRATPKQRKQAASVRESSRVTLAEHGSSDRWR